MKFDFYATLVTMVIVLLLGVFVIKRVKFLRDYNIPEPVVGGGIAAIILLILHSSFSLNIKFDESMKDPLMLAFFSSIGLLADFASLKKGGRKLAVFLVVVVGLLFAQNIVGIGVATAMGQNPLMGLIAGSVTMSGGHGTGAAWAAEFIKEPYLYSSATTVAIACATFGLISGGIIGGPVARYLVNKHKLVVPKQND
ncbi:TPA: sodium/glutamate symporter, partial [Campylobacter lari]|nr:sodium/glutamate symporter [Campylobacter lari]